MNIKKEALTKLGLAMLIGTPFEELMRVEELKAEEELSEINYRDYGAIYIYSGLIFSTIYSFEGKEAYRSFEKGALIGSSDSLSEEENVQYGIDFKSLEDSILIYLPFKEIFNIDLDDSKEIYRQLFNLIAREKNENTNYMMGRMIYTDEEFLLKALEERKVFNNTSIELARGLNMKLRNLQRYLKIYSELGIIEKERNRIAIKDMDKFNEYKSKILDEN